MKFIVQDPFSIKKVLIFGGFGLCRFQHKVGMNSFHMRMNVFSYGTNSFPWGMYSFRSKIPIVCFVLTEGQRGNAVKSKYSFESPGIFKPFMCRSVVNGFFAATAAAAGGRWAEDGVTV